MHKLTMLLLTSSPLMASAVASVHVGANTSVYSPSLGSICVNDSPGDQIACFAGLGTAQQHIADSSGSASATEGTIYLATSAGAFVGQASAFARGSFDYFVDFGQGIGRVTGTYVVAGYSTEDGDQPGNPGLFTVHQGATTAQYSVPEGDGTYTLTTAYTGQPIEISANGSLIASTPGGSTSTASLQITGLVFAPTFKATANPEPSTWALGLSGLLLLCRRRRAAR